MNIVEKSARIRTLMNDDTFKEVMAEIRSQQIAVFLDANSITDKRNGAHDIVCALRKIDDYFDSVIADEAMHNRKLKKGKHRESD
jgi:hypothetical protein